jgi:hypothetical protein
MLLAHVGRDFKEAVRLCTDLITLSLLTLHVRPLRREPPTAVFRKLSELLHDHALDSLWKLWDATIKDLKTCFDPNTVSLDILSRITGRLCPIAEDIKQFDLTFPDLSTALSIADSFVRLQEQADEEFSKCTDSFQVCAVGTYIIKEMAADLPARPFVRNVEGHVNSRIIQRLNDWQPPLVLLDMAFAPERNCTYIRIHDEWVNELGNGHDVFVGAVKSIVSDHRRLYNERFPKSPALREHIDEQITNCACDLARRCKAHVDVIAKTAAKAALPDSSSDEDIRQAAAALLDGLDSVAGMGNLELLRTNLETAIREMAPS